MRLVVLPALVVSIGWLVAGSQPKPAGAAPDLLQALVGRIAFSGGAQPALDVYVVGADGSGLRRLTRHPAAEFDPAWSPDGRRIVYRFQPGEDATAEIYVMNADGSGKRNLTRRAGQDHSPAWSPDGRRIAFASVRKGPFPEIWVMSPDGSGARRLTRVPGEYPDWSPDGRRLVFDRNTFGPTEWDIWAVNADGSAAKPLIAWRGSDEKGAAWSPDGAWIAFESDRRSDDGLPRIWLARADGSHARRLTAEPGERPAWSPDGRQIVFTGNGLFAIRRDGRSLRRIPTGVTYPALADWGR